VGSTNDHERADRNDQTGHHDRYDSETTMQIRSVRRHETRLSDDQDAVTSRET